MSKLHKQNPAKTCTEASSTVENHMVFTSAESTGPTRPISLPNRRRKLWVDLAESPRSAPSAYYNDYRVFIEYPKDTVDTVYVNYDILSQKSPKHFESAEKQCK
jgi:hypothetical protein